MRSTKATGPRTALRPSCYNRKYAVGVAQLAEHRTVAPDVAGSIPVSHPRIQSLECFPRRQRSFLGIIGAPHIVSAYANGLSPLLFQKYARMITLATAA